MTLRIGGRHVADHVPRGTLTSDHLVLGASRSFLDRRLELTGEKSFGLSGEGEASTSPVARALECPTPCAKMCALSPLMRSRRGGH
jgi:hypothetical protein